MVNERGVLLLADEQHGTSDSVATELSRLEAKLSTENGNTFLEAFLRVPGDCVVGIADEIAE